jgi:hypothetical protein
MQVGKYISDLLYRHECVVVPGYGAFISRRVAAQHFAATGTLYPPKKGLSFNAQIQQNDGLLVNYIATVEQLPYNDALQQVRNYIRFLEHELDTRCEVTLHKIGRFTRNEEGSLQFAPMYLVNYLPEAYGLHMQEVFAVDRSAVQPMVATAQEPVIEKPVAQLETPASRTAAWVRAAAAIAVLVAGSYTGYQAYQQQSLQDAATVEEMAQQEFKSKVQEASFMINTPLPSVTMEVAPVVKNYHVIAGAFRSPANADKKVAQLQKVGFDADRIGVNKYGLHNVAFGSFVDRNDAINELYRIRKLGYDGAWLLSGSLK